MTVAVYILLCMIWGSTWMAIKIGLADAPPFYLLAFRFVVAIPLLLLLIRFRGERITTEPRRFIRIGYPGIYMFGMSYAFVYFSEMFIASALSAVLFACFPFFVALFTIWILPDERLSSKGWLGLVVGFSGVVVIFYDSITLSGEVVIGTMLALAAPLVSAYGILIHKQRYGQEQVFPTLTIQLISGGIPLMILALILEDISSFNVTANSVGSVLYLGIFGTIVTFGGYYWLLKRIRVVHASLIAFITPLVAIVIGVIIFGEAFRTTATIGTIMVLSGVLLVTRR